MFAALFIVDLVNKKQKTKLKTRTNEEQELFGSFHQNESD
jgi:hypothetical protein